MSSLRVRPYAPPSLRRDALARAGSPPGPIGARQGYALALITAVLIALGGLLPGLAVISRDAVLQLRSPGPADLNTLVMAVTAPVALVFTGWLLVAVIASSAAALLAAIRPVIPARAAGDRGFGHQLVIHRTAVHRASRYAGLIAPSLLRHGIAALLGVTLLAGPAAAATGELNSPAPVTPSQTAPVRPGQTTPVTPPSGTGASASASPASLSAAWPGLPLATRAVPGYLAGTLPPVRSSPPTAGGWTPSVPVPARAESTGGSDIGLVAASGQHRRLDDDDRMVVHQGDTLWSIAARSLGPGAQTAEIASEWPRWFTENKDVIGPDPDRLDPGQRLRPPPAASRSGSSTVSSGPASRPSGDTATRGEHR